MSEERVCEMEDTSLEISRLNPESGKKLENEGVLKKKCDRCLTDII